MSEQQMYSVRSARAAAERDETATWVKEFLASPGSDNAGLAEELSERLGWWTGPVQLPIDQLHRLAGPPGDPVLCAVPDEYWRDDVEELGDKVGEGWEPPPVIVAFRDGQLMLEDGNHRVEGLRRAGQELTWAMVGFESPDDRVRFASQHAGSAGAGGGQ